MSDQVPRSGALQSSTSQHDAAQSAAAASPAAPFAAASSADAQSAPAEPSASSTTMAASSSANNRTFFPGPLLKIKAFATDILTEFVYGTFDARAAALRIAALRHEQPELAGPIDEFVNMYGDASHACAEFVTSTAVQNWAAVYMEQYGHTHEHIGGIELQAETEASENVSTTGNEQVPSDVSTNEQGPSGVSIIDQVPSAVSSSDVSLVRMPLHEPFASNEPTSDGESSYEPSLPGGVRIDQLSEDVANRDVSSPVIAPSETSTDIIEGPAETRIEQLSEAVAIMDVASPIIPPSEASTEIIEGPAGASAPDAASDLHLAEAVVQAEVPRISITDHDALTRYSNRRLLVEQTFPELYSAGNDDVDPLEASKLVRLDVDELLDPVPCASQKIHCGKRILREKLEVLFRLEPPLFGKVLDVITQMTAEKQRHILKIGFNAVALVTATGLIAKHVPAEQSEAGGNRLILLIAILLYHTSIQTKTNGGTINTVHPATQRLGYSCTPNMYNGFNEATKTAFITAMRDIEPGEPLTLGRPELFKESWAILPRDERVRKLAYSGFVCACVACKAPRSAAARVSEGQRGEIRRILGQKKDMGDLGLQRLERLKGLYEAVGFGGVYLADVLFHLGNAQMAAGQKQKGFSNMKKGAATSRTVLGQDDPEYQKVADRLAEAKEEMRQKK